MTIKLLPLLLVLLVVTGCTPLFDKEIKTEKCLRYEQDGRCSMEITGYGSFGKEIVDAQTSVISNVGKPCTIRAMMQNNTGKDLIVNDISLIDNGERFVLASNQKELQGLPVKLNVPGFLNQEGQCVTK